jgi:hypothetical protein
MGNKAVSSETRREFESCVNRTFDSDLDVTSAMVEHYYSRTGIQLKGGCEMKQRWYPTQASPRTYFAQGGSAYHSSKFLRDPFNWLCDLYYPTNRYSRVSPSGIPVNLGEDDIFVYDLTSFTSLFHEQRSFLIFLADLTMDEMIMVFDSWEGPVRVSLGSLILEYVSTNLMFPTYETKISILSNLELHHSVAGFLGVFGNLATCTFPHGVCLSTVRDNPDECWCAGDDAGTKDIRETHGMNTRSMSEALGSIAFEKTFVASESGAIALKRPVSVIGGLLYQHPNILWPVFAVMIDEDPRFRLPPCPRRSDRVMGAIVSFLRSCQRVPLSATDVEFAFDFFTVFYQRHSLPLSGWYPPLTGYFPWRTTIPRIDKTCFGKDPIHVLINSFYGTEYITGLVDELPWDKHLPPLNESFVCNSEKHLAYLVKLGYLSRELITCMYPGAEGLARARLDVDHPPTLRLVYTYVVIEHIPSNLEWLSHEDTIQ